jgi:hypothetical protein
MELTELTVKCTTCKKTLPATQAQMDEARDMGCFFSACCQAVATVERVTAKAPKRKVKR